jgi:hypothetical protein
MSMHHWLRSALLIVGVALQGCASYSPDSLAPRATLADATAKLGKPTAQYALAGGAKRLEFARGPFGLHTYMLDFDASGLLVKSTQVLYEENFATIKDGMSRDDVLLALGRPAHEYGVWSGNKTMWAYRFDSPQCLWFLVGLSPQGHVASTQYGPDPRCEVGGDKGDRS